MSHKSTKRSGVKTSRGKREGKANFRPRKHLRWWMGIAGLLLAGVAIGLLATKDRGGPTLPLDARKEKTAESSGSATWDPSWPALPAPAHRAAGDMDEIRSAYAFAARQAELLQYIPCYCGCERVGHRSNLDCYVKGFTPDGRPKWDVHAFT